MNFTRLLVFLAIFLAHFSYGQNNTLRIAEIDSLTNRIDNIETSTLNIGHFIVPRYSDNDTTRLYNRYIFDTLKRNFYKCIYDCSFRGLEKIVFYFSDRELIKVVVNVNEYNKDPFNAIYYFDKGEPIHKIESNSSTRLWNIDRIKAQAKQYLDEVDGIITYLDKGKRRHLTCGRHEQ
jgi:hypothetical protein